MKYWQNKKTGRHRKVKFIGMKTGDFIRNDTLTGEALMLYLGECSPATKGVYDQAYTKQNAHLYTKCTEKELKLVRQELLDWVRERCKQGFEKGGFVKLKEPINESSGGWVVVGHMDCIKDSSYVCNACNIYNIAYLYR